MAVRTIILNGQAILVEVVPEAVDDRVPAPAPEPEAADDRLAARAGVEYETVSLKSDAVDAAARIKDIVAAVVLPIQQSVAGLGVAEWSVELSFGFKGGAGIPFLVNGEANGAVKVSAKWKGA